MAAKKYIALVTGKLKQIAATVVSAGAGNDGDLVALDATGHLDMSVLPTGVGAETKVVLTSEILADGDYVNIYDNAGTANVRKADASSPAKYANGFVKAGYANATNATVYVAGINDHDTGQVAGTVFLSDVTPGKATATVPTTAGHIVQQLGDALSATEVAFEPKQSVELA